MRNPTDSPRYLVAHILLLMLVSIVNVADKELLAPVADAVRVELYMSDTQLGTVRSAVFLAALLGQFLWGPLSDRWVRKYVIAIGALIWSAITWLTALVGSFPQLLVARASMSFAEGAFNPHRMPCSPIPSPNAVMGSCSGWGSSCAWRCCARCAGIWPGRRLSCRQESPVCEGCVPVWGRETLRVSVLSARQAVMAQDPKGLPQRDRRPFAKPRLTAGRLCSIICLTRAG